MFLGILMSNMMPFAISVAASFNFSFASRQSKIPHHLTKGSQLHITGDYEAATDFGDYGDDWLKQEAEDEEEPSLAASDVSSPSKAKCATPWQ